jgi:Ca-activated chloride channel family protein
MSFHQPSVWLLLALAVLPLLWWLHRGGRMRGAIAYSSVGVLEQAGSSWAVRVRAIVPALRAAALVVLVVCMARPQKANEHARVFAEGIAIQLIIDRSGSMEAEDFKLQGRTVTRLEAVKKVVEDFIDGGDELPGRPDDLIGLITFATYADSLCPLTLDHGFLLDAVRQTRVSPVEEDRATAIGDALALAVERMNSVDEQAFTTAERRIKGKVIVLLTDGESNAGEIDPMTAARMAAALGLKVHTIAAGTGSGAVPVTVTDPFGRTMRQLMQVSVDEETLQEIAQITGGQFFRATDTRTLRGVYEQIDTLERTRIQERRYSDYRELAVEGLRLGSLNIPPLLSVVMVLLVVEILLSNTRFRTLP